MHIYLYPDLVIEDNFTDNKMQNNLLGSLGYTCFASSPEAALCGAGLIQVS